MQENLDNVHFQKWKKELTFLSSYQDSPWWGRVQESYEWRTDGQQLFICWPLRCLPRFLKRFSKNVGKLLYFWNQNSQNLKKGQQITSNCPYVGLSDVISKFMKESSKTMESFWIPGIISPEILRKTYRWPKIVIYLT